VVVVGNKRCWTGLSLVLVVVPARWMRSPQFPFVLRQMRTRAGFVRSATSFRLRKDLLWCHAKWPIAADRNGVYDRRSVTQMEPATISRRLSCVESTHPPVAGT
jgi:hypothetical protein